MNYTKRVIFLCYCVKITQIILKFHSLFLFLCKINAKCARESIHMSIRDRP